jgi:hypothetical protein
MPYEKMPPIKGGVQGCLNCGFVPDTLPMDAIIAVGFGYAAVTKNDKTVYDEQEVDYGSRPDYWTTQDAENAALLEPDSDWRIHLVGPLSERHYQRQGPGLWVLYEKGEGFA